MSLESGTASLHAGMIERARPRREALDDPFAPVRPVKEQGAIPPLDPARERPVFGLRRVQPVSAPETASPVPTGRRYGLTVRVHADLRERLRQFGQMTGRTNQSILHEALEARLAAAGISDKTH